MPIYEYKCRKCGAVNEYLEKQGDWHLLPRKCKQCGRRKTQRILSPFSSTVQRSHTETLNELKQLGNVQFVPRQTPSWGQGSPPGGCPYESADKEEKREARQVREPPVEIKSG